MTNSDDLFVLIKSLTKGEKRFFRLYAAKRSSSEATDYQSLFDALDAMRSYDEHELRSQVSESIRKHLPQAKHYLYRTLLRALSQYTIASTVIFQIHELLQAVGVLYEKRLYGQCRKLLHRAKRLALESDNELYVLLVLVDEYRLAIIESDPIQTEGRIDEIFDQMIRYTDRRAIHNRYWRIQAKMFWLMTETGDGRSPDWRARCDRLLNDPLMAEGDSIEHPVTKLFYLFIQDHYHDCFGNRDHVYELRKKIVELIEQEPSLRQKRIERYLPALYNLCMVLIYTRRFEEFRSAFAKIRSVVAGIKERRPNFNDMHVRMLEPRLLVEAGEFERARETLNELESEFLRTRGTLRRGFSMYFCYIWTLVHFSLGDAATALRWIDIILSARDRTVHLELQCYARLLNLAIHYDLGHLVHLDSLVVSAGRFLARYQRLGEFERLVLDMFRKLSASDREKTRERLRESKEILSRLREETGERGAFTYFDVVAWIDARLEQTTIAEVLRCLVTVGAGQIEAGAMPGEAPLEASALADDDR